MPINKSESVSFFFLYFAHVVFFPGMSANILTKSLKWVLEYEEDLDNSISSRKDSVWRQGWGWGAGR